MEPQEEAALVSRQERMKAGMERASRERKEGPGSGDTREGTLRESGVAVWKRGRRGRRAGSVFLADEPGQTGLRVLTTERRGRGETAAGKGRL